MENDNKFYISDLHMINDETFSLAITDKEEIERLYTVSIRVNRNGELVGLKSEKRS